MPCSSPAFVWITETEHQVFLQTGYTFAVFNNEDDCNAFLSHLNSLHPSLLFTHEKESNHSLPFLDVFLRLKDVTPNFQHQSTGSLPSLANIYAGIPSAPTNGKSI